MKSIALLIPTYNAGALWADVLDSIAVQTLPLTEKIIVDSGSTDQTLELAARHEFRVITIPKADFNHGGTRQLLVDSSRAELCIFMTQDAVLARQDSLEQLTSGFTDETVGLAYGRQLPRPGATTLEAHLRHFNYPEKSIVRAYADKDSIGFKVFFSSNSFACYRRSALQACGGFVKDSIMGEDALAGAKMLMLGYKISYVANALVQHSHNYSFGEEFKRYFDTRVFHEQNEWLIKEYGKPTGEGIKFVKSALAYVLRHDPIALFRFVGSLGAKWSGYKAGKYYRKLPPSLIPNLSMQKDFWKVKLF